MTDFQKQLIAIVTTKTSGKWMAARASFNGSFLNCEADITSGSKVKKQKWSFVFDSAEDCQGAKIVKQSGTYAEHFARDTFEAICNFSASVAKLAI